MKITAIIDDGLIQDALKYSKSDTVTNALKAALKDFVKHQKLKEIREKIKKKPFEFTASAEELRNLNREI